MVKKGSTKKAGVDKEGDQMATFNFTMPGRDFLSGKTATLTPPKHIIKQSLSD